jgi:lysophospholipase L1-like esterase
VKLLKPIKTILCFGDSNTWGYIPAKERAESEIAERYLVDVKWPGVLSALLGKEYHVVESGLSGRTTAINDVLGKYRDGAKYLGVCLSTNKPVDLLILMLGVNDTKRRFLTSSAGISKGLEKLISVARSGSVARSSGFGPGGGQPKILVISPARLRKEVMESFLRLEFDQNSLQKSQELAELFFDVSRRRHCYYMNAAAYIKASKIDGLHLDAKSHRKLAEAIAVKILEIFETPS